MLNSFLEKHRYTLLGAVLIVLILAFFCFVDVPYTIYGVSVDSQMAEPDVLPVPEYQAGSDHGAVVLMYHHLVTDTEMASGKYADNNAIISVSQFAEEMRYLAENGYHTFKMSEVASILYNSLSFPEKSVIITFDDGYASNYTLAYPILQDYNLKATIAVVVLSSMVASDDGGLTSQNIPHLSFDQMREMQQSGLVEIGSHSYDGHGMIKSSQSGDLGRFFIDRKYLTDEGRRETDAEYRDRINQDLRLSKYVLESELNTVVNYFAYPYGVTNGGSYDALARNGFLVAVTTAKGTINSRSDALKLNRRNVDQGISLTEFARLLEVK